MIDWRPRSTGDRDRPLLPRFDVTVVDENRVMLVETRTSGVGGMLLLNLVVAPDLLRLMAAAKSSLKPTWGP